MTKFALTRKKNEPYWTDRISEDKDERFSDVPDDHRLLSHLKKDEFSGAVDSDIEGDVVDRDLYPDKDSDRWRYCRTGDFREKRLVPH